jgi:hypothetical protein
LYVFDTEVKEVNLADMFICPLAKKILVLSSLKRVKRGVGLDWGCNRFRRDLGFLFLTTVQGTSPRDFRAGMKRLLSISHKNSKKM